MLAHSNVFIRIVVNMCFKSGAELSPGDLKVSDPKTGGKAKKTGTKLHVVKIEIINKVVISVCTFFVIV